MKFLARSLIVLGVFLAAALTVLVVSVPDLSSELQILPVSLLDAGQAFAQFQKNPEPDEGSGSCTYCDEDDCQCPDPPPSVHKSVSLRVQLNRLLEDL